MRLSREEKSWLNKGELNERWKMAKERTKVFCFMNLVVLPYILCLGYFCDWEVALKSYATFAFAVAFPCSILSV